MVRTGPGTKRWMAALLAAVFLLIPAHRLDGRAEETVVPETEITDAAAQGAADDAMPENEATNEASDDESETAPGDGGAQDEEPTFEPETGESETEPAAEPDAEPSLTPVDAEPDPCEAPMVTFMTAPEAQFGQTGETVLEAPAIDVEIVCDTETPTLALTVVSDGNDLYRLALPQDLAPITFSLWNHSLPDAQGFTGAVTVTAALVADDPSFPAAFWNVEARLSEAAITLAADEQAGCGFTLEYLDNLSSGWTYDMLAGCESIAQALKVKIVFTVTPIFEDI